MHKILIIEDDQAYRKVYKRKFEVSGYAVDVAENGKQGLEKLQSFHPDLVFLDVMMPEMDGFQVLDKTKSDPATNAIPIVMTTNLSTGDDAQKLLQKGALAVIVKSDSDPNALVAKAVEILGDNN